MNLTRHLIPLPAAPPQVRHRVLPAQPPGLQSGEVFCGLDLGFVPYTGPQPQAGDLVIIMQDQGRRLVQSQAAVNNFIPALTSPTFNSGCVCKCPAAGGAAFYLGFSNLSAFILAMDAVTGTLQQVFGTADLGYGATAFPADASLAVDPVAPNTLYVLDDRRVMTSVRTDTTPSVRRGYFALVTYTLAAGQYAFSSAVDLVDPYVPPAGGSLNPSVEPDPPAIPSNCVSVPAGVPLITMKNSPGRYLSIAGAAITTHTLVQNGVNYGKGLVGNIVRLKDTPGKPSLRYVIGFDSGSTTYELVEFNAATDAVTRTLPLALAAAPKQLAAVCNRLMILVSATDTFNS